MQAIKALLDRVAHGMTTMEDAVAIAALLAQLQMFEATLDRIAQGQQPAQQLAKEALAIRNVH